jgi:hypothetical protein
MIDKPKVMEIELLEWEKEAYFNIHSENSALCSVW